MKSKHSVQILRPHRLRAAGGLLAVALALMIIPGVSAEPVSPSREMIAVEGNLRVDAETVRSHFKAGADGQFDEAARDAALKSLIATRLFDKVSIDRSAGKLVVRVTEAPVLDRVAFEGNKKVKDADLSAAIEIQAARPAAARNHPVRRQSHRRGLPACRARRSQRRA